MVGRDLPPLGKLILHVVRSYNLPSNEQIVNLTIHSQRVMWASKLVVTGVSGDTYV